MECGGTAPLSHDKAEGTWKSFEGKGQSSKRTEERYLKAEREEDSGSDVGLLRRW